MYCAALWCLVFVGGTGGVTIVLELALALVFVLVRLGGTGVVSPPPYN